MLFNLRKKKMASFMTDDTLKLKINNKPIEFTCDYKYLGIWLNSDLTFSRHVKSIISNVSLIRLKNLSRIRNCVTNKTALLLYKSMIVPLYDYGVFSSITAAKKNCSKNGRPYKIMP